MRVGVRAHDFGKLSPECLAQALHRSGYECAQLAIPKAIAGIDSYADITHHHLDAIREAFQRNQVEITVLGSYMDLTSPDKDIRAYAIDTLKASLAHARALGAVVVGTETAYDWLNAEEKKTRYQWMVDGLLRATEEAARLDVKLAVEPVYLHPLDGLEAVLDVMEKVGDPQHLRMILDPANVLEFPQRTDQETYWLQWLQHTGQYTEAMHMKDFRPEPDGRTVSTPLGEGIIRYDVMAGWLRSNRPDMPLLREGMQPASAEADIAFMKNL